jgi:hypothetical protein
MTVPWRDKYGELADLVGAELAGHDRRLAVQQETAEEEVRVRASPDGCCCKEGCGFGNGRQLPVTPGFRI